MFKDMPYFCYSHLLALITVAPETTGPAPVFNPLLPPPQPLYIDRVLTPGDVARARQLIALVRWVTGLLRQNALECGNVAWWGHMLCFRAMQ